MNVPTHERRPLERLFGAGGVLARLLPEYETRACQLQMADFVEGALAAGQHALVEAGTGTGKSLAYLAPLLRSKSQAVVSTATKALQDQLWFHDLPLAVRLTGVSPVVARLKGRANYLCLLSLDAQARMPDAAVVGHMSEVRAWADRTASGDMDELGEGATPVLRAALTRGMETCEGRLCPYVRECWAEKARAQAADARIVITNHHLVLVDAKLRAVGDEDGTGMPLPQGAPAVLDEAHTLEDAATSVFAAEIDAGRASRMINTRRVIDAVGRGRAGTIRAALEASTAAFAQVERTLATGRTPIREEVPSGIRLAELATELSEAAGEVADGEERAWLSRRLRELAMDADRVFRVGDPDWVHYAERSDERGIVATAAPIDVASTFKQLVADRRQVIGTSATLTVGGSFDYAADRLGLAGAEGMVTEPAFDYRRQALLYLPRDVAEPPAGGGASEAYAAAIAARIEALVQASGGGAFCLFTSHRALRDAWRRLSGRLAFPVLRQGQAPTPVLLDQFRAAGNAVLFGTRSFWEGVDVPGEALSLVIITRLPFAVPDDPVIAARTDRLRAEGRNWFGEFALPRATLLLKQGVGRLIRSSQDRGVVAILDRRLTTRRYGALVLDSLPPARRTDELADVYRFFRSRGR